MNDDTTPLATVQLVKGFGYIFQPFLLSLLLDFEAFKDRDAESPCINQVQNPDGVMLMWHVCCINISSLICCSNTTTESCLSGKLCDFSN